MARRSTGICGTAWVPSMQVMAPAARARATTSATALVAPTTFETWPTPTSLTCPRARNAATWSRRSPPASGTRPGRPAVRCRQPLRSGAGRDLVLDPAVALGLELADELRPALLDDPPVEHDRHARRLDHVQDPLVVGDDQDAHL